MASEFSFSQNGTLPTAALTTAQTYLNPPTIGSTNTLRSEGEPRHIPADNGMVDVQSSTSPESGMRHHPEARGAADFESAGNHHFDWDKWDAVFGHHRSLGDLTDDVNWSVHHEPDYHHEAMVDDMDDMMDQ